MNKIEFDMPMEEKKKIAHQVIDSGEFVCMQLVGKTTEQGGGFQLKLVCGDVAGLLGLYFQMFYITIRDYLETKL